MEKFQAEVLTKLGELRGALDEHTDQDQSNFEELRRDIARVAVSQAVTASKVGGAAGGKRGAQASAAVAAAFLAIAEGLRAWLGGP